MDGEDRGDEGAAPGVSGHAAQGQEENEDVGRMDDEVRQMVAPGLSPNSRRSIIWDARVTASIGRSERS